jgi:predicted nuclease of predicted toxin-antitoxin system
VRFLVDQNLSPLIAAGLRKAGYDAAHTNDLGLERAEDNDVLLRARSEERIVVSADTDFGALLAESGTATPSVILIRRTADRSADRLLRLVLANLPTVEEALADGAIVVFDAERMRVRRLPLL